MKLTEYKIDRKDRQWYLFDAEDKIMGRLCAEIAEILMGKHKPTYTPIFDSGDNVVVTNAEKIKLSGFKSKQKKYYRPTGYIGNLKTMDFEDLLAKKPEWLIRECVRKMLPKSLLGRKMMKKLRVYKGAEHPHLGTNFNNLTASK